MQFVARAVRVLREYNCEPATPDEARRILGLPAKDRAVLKRK